jgi:hypothetical protein
MKKKSSIIFLFVIVSLFWPNCVLAQNNSSTAVAPDAPSLIATATNLTAPSTIVLNQTQPQDAKNLTLVSDAIIQSLSCSKIFTVLTTFL